jgi:hypothetical protein
LIETQRLNLFQLRRQHDHSVCSADAFVCQVEIVSITQLYEPVSTHDLDSESILSRCLKKFFICIATLPKTKRQAAKKLPTAHYLLPTFLKIDPGGELNLARIFGAGDNSEAGRSQSSAGYLEIHPIEHVECLGA